MNDLESYERDMVLEDLRAEESDMRAENLRECYRANEYAGFAGEELPYPDLRHEHRWDAEQWCSICGADGAA